MDKRIRKDLQERFPTAGIASGGEYGDK